MNHDPKTPNQEIQQKGVEFWQAVRNWFHDLIDLNDGCDRHGTIEYIRNNRKMRGANAWMLVCSIMIASLGLDLNSPAVIIGAMLISPLMSPILGIGLGVGINDKETFFTSLRHFGISIAIALISSTLYFSLTPFGDFTNEIAGRTQPTLLDGLVAVFGGFAGIISVSRTDKSNAIPGVAIATALMPPLCVSGYGLANGEWFIMANSFYLFFLNSFFIAATSFIIIRFLRFPMHSFVNAKEQRRTQWILTIFSLIVIIPSAYILYNVLQGAQLQNRIGNFKKEYFSGETQVVGDKYQPGDSTNLLILQLVGEPIDEDSLAYLYEGLAKYQIEKTELALIQNKDLGLEELNRLRNEVSGIKTVAEQLKTVNLVKSEQDKELQVMQSQIDSLNHLHNHSVMFTSFSEKAKALFPDLEKIAFSKMQLTDFEEVKVDIPVVMVDWQSRKSSTTRRRDEKKLGDWAKIEMKLDTVAVVAF
ncbi:MAG: DUF389 domain-containing protein [Saprospiraceae bacterium]